MFLIMFINKSFSGYIANGPQWCSNESDTTGMSPPGTLCPGWEATPDCPQGAQRAFWIAASINYGSRASGEIFILLNATSDPIFSNNTYVYNKLRMKYEMSRAMTKPT
jgi:hypothetical protein